MSASAPLLEPDPPGGRAGGVRGAPGGRARRGRPPAGRPLAVLALAPLLLLVVALQDAFFIFRPAPPAPCPAVPALVMGAAQYDGTPSPALQRRLDKALELYRGGCASRIVVSGGRQPGDRFSEGGAGQRYLAARGVPAAALAAETRAGSSLENLSLSRELLGDGAVLIVTDDLHAHRSGWLARRLGIDAQLAAVRTPAGSERLAYGLRELLTLTAYRLGVVR